MSRLASPNGISAPLERGGDIALGLRQQQLEQLAEEEWVLVQGLEGRERRRGVEPLSCGALEGGEQVLDEWPVEGLELDRGGEVEERCLLVGEHRRQRVAVGAGEHGGEPVATLVEAGAERGDERAVRHLGRQ